MSLKVIRHRPSPSALVLALAATSILAWAAAGRTADDKDQDRGGELAIPPAWKVGEHHRYERVKTRRKLQGGKETFRSSGRGPIDVSVIEAGEKGFLVRWRIGETTPDDPRAAADPNVRAMSRLVEGLDVDLELDAEATITGVRNWTEMKAAAVKITDAVVKTQQEAGADAKTLAAVRSAIEAMFATKQRVEQTFTKEPQVFFLPIGRSYPGIGKAITYEDRLPNPLGGPPFPCKGKISLTSNDAAQGRATVTWTQTADPAETARILAETLKAITERTGQAPPQGDQLKTRNVEDHTEFVIDTRTGWVEQFTFTREDGPFTQTTP